MCCLDVLLALAATLSVGAAAEPEAVQALAQVHGPAVTHGVAAGDVTDHSAVIWSRTDGNGVMHVRVRSATTETTRTVPVRGERDYAGKAHVDGLAPDTQYAYEVWFAAGDHGVSASGSSQTGRFRTAPAPGQRSPVTLAWGGDLAGQNVCRDVAEGFPIFDAINDLDLDFFIGLGDMIYADGICEDVGRYGNRQVAGDFGRAATLPDYWAHWRYNRQDDGYRRLLSRVPYYAIWDDHETVNDVGPLHDTRSMPPYTPGEHLLPKGLAAFLDYNPVQESGRTPKRLYRSIRWGQHLEMFILDTRQYRDANFETDDPRRPKTLLGREQLTWLEQKVSASDATWKLIVSSVPMSIPTGWPPKRGRDGWAGYDQATGFQHELSATLSGLKESAAQNLVWISSDVHCAAVFRYTPFADARGFQVYEFIASPLSAGLFPKRRFDKTLGTERLFFYGPEDQHGRGLSYEQARSLFNFGVIHIDAEGRLTASIRNTDGEALYALTLSADR